MSNKNSDKEILTKFILVGIFIGILLALTDRGYHSLIFTPGVATLEALTFIKFNSRSMYLVIPIYYTLLFLISGKIYLKNKKKF